MKLKFNKNRTCRTWTDVLALAYLLCRQFATTELDAMGQSCEDVLPYVIWWSRLSSPIVYTPFTTRQIHESKQCDCCPQTQHVAWLQSQGYYDMNAMWNKLETYCQQIAPQQKYDIQNWKQTAEHLYAHVYKHSFLSQSIIVACVHAAMLMYRAYMLHDVKRVERARCCFCHTIFQSFVVPHAHACYSRVANHTSPN